MHTTKVVRSSRKTVDRPSFKITNPKRQFRLRTLSVSYGLQLRLLWLLSVLSFRLIKDDSSYIYTFCIFSKLLYSLSSITLFHELSQAVDLWPSFDTFIRTMLFFFDNVYSPGEILLHPCTELSIASPLLFWFSLNLCSVFSQFHPFIML